MFRKEAASGDADAAAALADVIAETQGGVQASHHIALYVFKMAVIFVDNRASDEGPFAAHAYRLGPSRCNLAVRRISTFLSRARWEGMSLL